MALCRRYAGEQTLAEDLLHDAFLRVFRSMDKFQWRGEGSLRAWLERVTVNVALEYLRRNSRMDMRSVEDMPGGGQRLPAEEAPVDTARIPAKVLMRFIEELPDGYRTVFNLFCIEGYSHREIASMLGINEKSSSSQLTRAKAMLARRIREFETRNDI